TLEPTPERSNAEPPEAAADRSLVAQALERAELAESPLVTALPPPPTRRQSEPALPLSAAELPDVPDSASETSPEALQPSTLALDRRPPTSPALAIAPSDNLPIRNDVEVRSAVRRDVHEMPSPIEPLARRSDRRPEEPAA